MLWDVTEPHRSPRLDLWFAVAAGPGPWLSGGKLAPADHLVLVGGVASAVVMSLAVTATAAASLQFQRWTGVAAFGAVLVSLVVVVFGGARRLARLGPVAVLSCRGAAALAVLALMVKAYGSVQPLALGGFGVAAGAHATVTLRAVGVRLRWIDALRRFLWSAVHAGVLTGAVILAFLPATRALRADALMLGLSIYALIATSTATMAVLGVCLERIDTTRDAQIATLRSTIHRDHAHWLHDDVCSELGYLRLRLQQGPVDADAIRRSLDELDHRLRVRQIDEILEGGPARLGEVMQPFIRVAQTNGVELTEVPSFETGAMLLAPVAGRQVQRALAVLTANAIRAGARQVAIRTSLEPGGLVVEVEDDAGGFDVTNLVPGRGLDGLAHDLGPDRLEIVRTERGTLARAHVAIAGDAVSV